MCAPIRGFMYWARKCRSPVIWIEESPEELWADERRIHLNSKLRRVVPLACWTSGLSDAVIRAKLCSRPGFHVPNLNNCLAEPDVQVPLDEIEIDENLRFVEEPIEIVERDVKKLKRRRIPLVKVRWNSRQGAEGIYWGNLVKRPNSG
ncbi:hypothetical protein Tco_1049302 [Tanacetum coccineum]